MWTNEAETPAPSHHNNTPSQRNSLILIFVHLLKCFTPSHEGERPHGDHVDSFEVGGRDEAHAEEERD